MVSVWQRTCHTGCYEAKEAAFILYAMHVVCILYTERGAVSQFWLQPGLEQQQLCLAAQLRRPWCWEILTTVQSLLRAPLPVHGCSASLPGSPPSRGMIRPPRPLPAGPTSELHSLSRCVQRVSYHQCIIIVCTVLRGARSSGRHAPFTVCIPPGAG